MFVKKVGFGVLVVLLGIGWLHNVPPLFQRDALIYVGPWWDFLRIYLIVLFTSTLVVSLWVIYELLFGEASLQRDLAKYLAYPKAQLNSEEGER